MLNVALWEPQIPPNTGNIARLCAANGATLHLIGPLGFRLDNRSLRRAGLDYWPFVNVEQHASWNDFVEVVVGHRPTRLFCFSVHAPKPYTALRYRKGDVLLFGNESRGLPQSILAANGNRNGVIPMLTDNVRSLNLGTAVGIVLYEALRQLHLW